MLEIRAEYKLVCVMPYVKDDRVCEVKCPKAEGCGNGLTAISLPFLYHFNSTPILLSLFICSIKFESK